MVPDSRVVRSLIDEATPLFGGSLESAIATGSQTFDRSRYVDMMKVIAMMIFHQLQPVNGAAFMAQLIANSVGDESLCRRLGIDQAQFRTYLQQWAIFYASLNEAARRAAMEAAYASFPGVLDPNSEMGRLFLLVKLYLLRQYVVNQLREMFQALVGHSVRFSVGGESVIVAFNAVDVLPGVDDNDPALVIDSVVTTTAPSGTTKSRNVRSMVSVNLTDGPDMQTTFRVKSLPSAVSDEDELLMPRDEQFLDLSGEAAVVAQLPRFVETSAVVNASECGRFVMAVDVPRSMVALFTAMVHAASSGNVIAVELDDFHTSRMPSSRRSSDACVWFGMNAEDQGTSSRHIYGPGHSRTDPDDSGLGFTPFDTTPTPRGRGW